MKRTILIFSLVLATIVSCKKYEEGPLISFRSANHRISGDWKVESFTANGADSMNYLQRYNLDGQWSFGEYVTYADPDLVVYNDSLTAGGVWSTSEMVDNHRTVYLRISSINCNRPYCFRTDTIQDWPFLTSWKILRLKENDMKLSSTQNAIEYKIHFRPF